VFLTFIVLFCVFCMFQLVAGELAMKEPTQHREAYDVVTGLLCYHDNDQYGIEVFPVLSHAFALVDVSVYAETDFAFGAFAGGSILGSDCNGAIHLSFHLGRFGFSVDLFCTYDEEGQ